MKSLILISFLSLPFTSQALETVESVDVAKYVKRWYQIARNPLPFEPLDCECAQQTLGVTETPGVVSVYNSCERPNGEFREVRGTATSLDPETNAKFEVDFGFPQKGSYWIIGLADDYNWAVVSDRNERSLYILSQTPDISPKDYGDALIEASKQLPLDSLAFTNHQGCSYPEGEVLK